MEPSALRIATAKLIGYGVTGTILDAALDVLNEFDPILASALTEVSDKVVEQFKKAEEEVWLLSGPDQAGV